MTSRSAETLRLVSYNILEGFQRAEEESGERRLESERASAAQDVIGELCPDFLVLNEALFAREHAGRIFDYKKLFGFPCDAAALYDGSWGNAVLSRYPILETSEMKIYNRSGLRARIATPGGDVTVATYHPHPGRHPERKAADFAALAGGVAGPLIVCGDFNSLDPEDRIDRTMMIEGFRRFSPAPEAAVDLFVESGRAVFMALHALGLRDAVPPAGRRYSIPTDLLSRDKSSAMRIDHVLVNDDIEIVSGEVFHSAASDRASDHHPVLVEFRIRVAQSN